MFFKCKTFVNIAELLFTDIFSKENICKNGQKIEKCQNFNKNFFRQFTRYDDMSKFGWKHVPPKCFEHLIILTNLLPVKTPPLSRPREKMTFFDQFFRFNQNFHMFGQQVLTKIFSWQESPDLPLHNPNFEFFVSLVVTKIFCFENQIHQNQVFK